MVPVVIPIIFASSPLLFCCVLQAVSDVERGWPLGTKEIYSKLTELKKKTARKEVTTRFVTWGQLLQTPSIQYFAQQKMLLNCGSHPLFVLLQYIKLAQKMKYYGFIQFKPCVADYPEKNTRIIASAGGRELNFRLQTSEVN